MVEYRIYAVPKGGFQHKILAIDGWAVHLTPDRGVVIEPLSNALCGKRFVIERKGWSTMPTEMLLYRAYEFSRTRRYSLHYNCEDFIEEVLGNPPKSAQRDIWVVVALAGTAVALASRL